MRKWLVTLREDKDLTQQHLADYIGVTRQTISAIENGTANPSIPVAQAIASKLGFSWVRFFDSSEQK